MKSAPVTKDEKARLQALYDYEVLDTEAENAFDDLTSLASEICGTPIALISLIDPHRQWFKSKVGIDAEQTDRDIAFCAHAIHHHEIFEVKDTLQDERFFDNPLVQGDPNIRFYAGTPLITPDGYAIGTLCTISDKPKALDSHQRKALEILGREVISQLELRLKVRQLKRADQRKTDYLSNISHELRTPLNAIVCYSELLNEKYPSLQLPSEIDVFVNGIKSSSRHLLDLVNAVLDIHKIEEGKMELNATAFNTDDFFQDLNRLTQAKAEERQVQLHFDITQNLPPALDMDEGKLRQILVNLINNAIKFSEPYHHVVMSVKVTEEHLEIGIEDQGCGISEDDIKKLFDKFAQVGNASGREGSGLGLAISKGLAELMGGSLHLESELDKGTRVTLIFPLQVADAPASDTESDDSIPAFTTDAKILVVEDNPVNQQVAEWIFDSLGLTIEIADTGEKGVEMASSDIDIVFMDLHLPGIDGFEATRQILTRFPDIPVIALSADAFAQTTEKASQSGMRGSLSKPIDKGQLIGTLNRYIPG